MTSTQTTTLRPWENSTLPISPASTPASDPDLLTENSNLRQECAELHELIAVQREAIDRLQRELRRERISAMQAAGACALVRAIYSTRTRTHQALVRVGGGA